MKRKIIVGNWKMNPMSLAEAKRISAAIKRTAAKLKQTYVVMCPPFVFLESVKGRTDSSLISVGAQDVYFEEQGAFTGEVSANMLKDLGATHVIVGHSERRAKGETDEIISRKVLAVLNAGMHPILCVGEAVRDTHGLYLETLKQQIKNSLNTIPRRLAGQLIVAYEPVWAIGAKEPMEPSIIQEMALFVKKVISDMYGQENALATPVLYGGSVNFRNAGDIMTRGGVDGLLVGRESVNTPGFIELVKAVDIL